MTWEAWTTLGVIGLVLAGLMYGRHGADLVIVGGVSLLVFLGILTPGEAIAGMANEGMLTVGVMYVVVCGLAETGGLAWLGRMVLGRPKTMLAAQVRMLAPVAAISAFMNNTPLVAMFIPVINDWCRQNKMSPSKFMIPLSYAAIFGGTCTIIGTSTNLVVQGMWNDWREALPEASLSAAGRPAQIGFFEIGFVGVPCALLGIALIIATTRWLLPARKPVLSVEDDARSYTVEMEVDAAGPLVGQTIEKAGLRHLPGLFLAEIDRAGQVLAAVGPDERLAADDRLVFVGVRDSVVELRKLRGLRAATDQVVKLDAPRPQRALIEAVISNTSPLIGRSIREGRFRSVYQAVVIAVARNGERVDQKIGDIVLRAGDTLLLEAHKGFAEQHKNSRDFFLVSRVENSAPIRHERALVGMGILVMMVVLATVEPVIPIGSGYKVGMFHAAVLAAGLMLATRCCNGPAARRSVDWSVLVMIATSLALGAALEKTGAAAVIAAEVIGVAGGSGVAALAVIYGLTMVFTNIITNNAAAALVFPIAIAAAERLGVDARPFVMAIIMGASACYATPIGYQTNLMVMNPGGYRFSDYLRLGLPLNLVLWAATVLLVPLIWPLTPTP